MADGTIFLCAGLCFSGRGRRFEIGVIAASYLVCRLSDGEWEATPGTRPCPCTSYRWQSFSEPPRLRARAARPRRCNNLPGAFSMERAGSERRMASFTLLYVRGHFVLTGLAIKPMKFMTRRQANGWARKHFPGSLVKEIVRKPTPRGPNRAVPESGESPDVSSRKGPGCRRSSGPPTSGWTHRALDNPWAERHRIMSQKSGGSDRNFQPVGTKR
jgi:hypothetical protein